VGGSFALRTWMRITRSDWNDGVPVSVAITVTNSVALLSKSSVPGCTTLNSPVVGLIAKRVSLAGSEKRIACRSASVAWTRPNGAPIDCTSDTFKDDVRIDGANSLISVRDTIADVQVERLGSPSSKASTKTESRVLSQRLAIRRVARLRSPCSNREKTGMAEHRRTDNARNWQYQRRLR